MALPWTLYPCVGSLADDPLSKVTPPYPTSSEFRQNRRTMAPTKVGLKQRQARPALGNWASVHRFGSPVLERGNPLGVRARSLRWGTWNTVQRGQEPSERR